MLINQSFHIFRASFATFVTFFLPKMRLAATFFLLKIHITYFFSNFISVYRYIFVSIKSRKIYNFRDGCVSGQKSNTTFLTIWL